MSAYPPPVLLPTPRAASSTSRSVFGCASRNQALQVCVSSSCVVFLLSSFPIFSFSCLQARYQISDYLGASGLCALSSLTSFVAFLPSCITSGSVCGGTSRNQALQVISSSLSPSSYSGYMQCHQGCMDAGPFHTGHTSMAES